MPTPVDESGRGQSYPLVNDRGMTESPTGERVIGLRTATGRDRLASFNPDRNQRRRSQYQRSKWEQSEVGQSRMQDIGDLSGGTLTPAQYHLERSYDRPPTTGPRIYDEQLPGMADPSAAPRPPRWEELSRDQQRASVRGLAQIAGTSLEKMESDFGAQYDQSAWNAEKAGSEAVYSEQFYSTGEPRKVLEDSARDLGIPMTVHAQMNAFTSPNTKFQSKRQASGEAYYPNNEAAVHAVRWAQQGGDPKEITNKLSDTGTGEGGRAQGYTTNIRKASLAAAQFGEGVPPSEWVTGAEGRGPFESSPKTGPYANSFSDSHPQFLVADVHTGGGGMLPHLSSSKPIKKDAEGNTVLDSEGKPVRDKSQREKAIESVPHFHAAADFAARKALLARGVGSLREGQAGQWGQEQVDRGLVPAAEAFPARPKKRELEGQLSFEIS